MASAIDPGTRAARTEDALAVFTVSAPTEDWDIPVLAVADGGNGRARGGLVTTAATDTLTDALSGRMLGLDLATRGWQGSVAEAVDAAYHQAGRRVAEVAAGGPGPAVATLTTALIVGDWLAVAHVGTARAYRLGRTELEQLTLDGARGQLGEPAAESPLIRFVRLKPGDVVCVCSDGLHRYVDGVELAGHLGERRPLGEIAGTLVALARSRGGEDNVAVCLARIGRLPARPLPEPEPLSLRLSDQVGTALLPTWPVRSGAWWRRPPVLAAAGVVALAVLAAAGVRGWQAFASRPAPEEILPAPVARETLATSGGDVAQGPAPEAPPRDVVQPPADTAAAEAPPAPPPPPTRSIADSIAEARAEAARLAPIRERQRRDSIARAEAAEEARITDSISAAGLAALRAEEARRARDSIAAVARRQRADSVAREQAAAEAREREDSARAEEQRRAREREARVTAGRRQLELWLASLVGAVESGNAAAPVLRQGPPRFADFVGKNKPAVGDARLTQVTVNESTGTANAEFTLRWKTEFGTTSTRRVRATATVVPAGDGWQVRSWQVLDGAP